MALFRKKIIEPDEKLYPAASLIYGYELDLHRRAYTAREIDRLLHTPKEGEEPYLRQMINIFYLAAGEDRPMQRGVFGISYYGIINAPPSSPPSRETWKSENLQKIMEEMATIRKATIRKPGLREFVVSREIYTTTDDPMHLLWAYVRPRQRSGFIGCTMEAHLENTRSKK